MAQEPRTFLNPKCLQFTDSKDKRGSFCRTSTSRQVTSIFNFRSQQLLVLLALLAIASLQMWTFTAGESNIDEFREIVRMSRMMQLINNINKDVVKIYDNLSPELFDVSGTLAEKKTAPPLTSNKIFMDAIHATHIRNGRLPIYMDQDHGWDIEIPVKGDGNRATVCWTGKNERRLFCVPRFYFIGFPESHAKDIFTLIQVHEKIITAELQHWWTKVDPEIRISQICFKYGQAMIKAEADSILGDLDETLILHMRKRSSEKHTHTGEPDIILPYMIQAMRSDTQFIVVLRNPIDAVFSSFLNAIGDERETQQLFHDRVVKLIEQYQNCFKTRRTRDCAHDPSLADKAIEAEIPLHTQFHAVFLADWLQVFTKEQFFFFRYEDFLSDRKAQLSSIFRFLNLPIPDWAALPEKTNFQAESTKTMSSETRELLKRFFEPHLIALSKILDSEKYLWGQYSSEELQENV